jgi:transposase
VIRPGSRSTEDQQALGVLWAGDGTIREAIELAEQFAAVVRSRDPAELTGWLGRAVGSSVAELRTLARGLRLDEAAVYAGVGQPWSNGVVEGQVDRLKAIKRSMYGRAWFGLLRARVLAAR